MQASNAVSSRFCVAAMLIAALIGGCGQSLTPEEYLSRGEAALARGELRAAVIAFKNVLQEQPGNAEARALLGQASLGLGDPVVAEQDLERAREMGADDARIQPWLARSWLQQGKYDQVVALKVSGEVSAERRAALLAVKSEARLAQRDLPGAEREADAALRADPNAVPALQAMARLKAVRGELDAAIMLVKQALERDVSNAEAENLLGEIERSAGRLDEAEAAYTRAMQDPVQGPRSQLNRATLRIQANRLDEAQSDIDALKKRVKDNLLVDYAEAQLLYARKDYAKAIERLDVLLGANPRYIPAVRLAGATRLALREPAVARIHLQRAVSALPDDVEARRMLIMALLQVGEAAEAERLARERIESAPEDTATTDLLASALMMQGKRDEGVSFLRRVSAVQSDSAAANVRLGTALLGQGDVEEGLKTLREALKQDPELRGAAEQLVFGYVSSGDLDQALKAAREYADRDPGSARAQALLGAVYLQREQVAEASQAFEKALELEPGNLAASTGLATLALRKDDLTAARGYFAKSLEAHPEDDRLRLLLARLAMAQKDTAAAKGYLDEAVERNPDALLPRLYLAAYYQRIGDSAESLNLLSETRRDFPNNPALLGLTADAQLTLRQFDAAKSTLEDLLIDAPNDPRVRVALASAYASLGESASAKVELKKALELDANLIPAVNLQARLAIAEKDLDGAEQALGELTRLLGPNHADVLLIEGQLAQIKGDLSAANGTFQRLLASGGDALDLDSDPGLRNAAEQLVLGYVRSGDPEGALKAALELRERQPESARVHDLVGALYLRAKQLDSAAQSFQRALELEPGDVAAIGGLAAIAIDGNELDRAEQLYEEGLKKHPNDIALFTGLARVALLRNDGVAAERYLVRSEQANPRALEPRLFLAAFHLRQGNPARALDVLTEASQLSPDAVQLLALRAEAELSLRRFEAARDTLIRLDRVRPDQPRVLIALARADAALGRLDDAEQSLRRAIKIDSGSVQALSSLAALAIARKSYDDAAARIGELERVLGAESANVLVLRGALAESQGDMEAALASYQRLFDQSPSMQSALLLARAHAKTNDLDGASHLLNDWLGQHPDDAQVRFELAQLQMRMQRPEQAITEFRAVLVKKPDNSIALNNLAWLLQEREPVQALEYARRAHELAPKSADIADTLAVLLMRNGDLREAGRMSDLALAADAENGSMLFHKAQILEKGGKRAQAERVLETALKVGGTFEERAEAEAMLKRLSGS
ncbi:XrtA/PEP-CTERM system TPR-repeat protein PrsT [Thiocystis violacea]|uniref:XrtA/PEP-CTERM system TPR-repeat protein PrsT n=1 Tax=Thiocystis violacea TaxID=13725 RepID=UPI0019080BA2|nr:XrtA/PEP-CTERM system TPR-repeat protein PrsT [Thiocystis violacea]MBK1722328.1 hypothetical protein [Thiocystis violacea]